MSFDFWFEVKGRITVALLNFCAENRDQILLIDS